MLSPIEITCNWAVIQDNPLNNLFCVCLCAGPRITSDAGPLPSTLSATGLSWCIPGWLPQSLRAFSCLHLPSDLRAGVTDVHSLCLALPMPLGSELSSGLHSQHFNQTSHLLRLQMIHFDAQLVRTSHTSCQCNCGTCYTLYWRS